MDVTIFSVNVYKYSPEAENDLLHLTHGYTKPYNCEPARNNCQNKCIQKIYRVYIIY